jgi:hypothetical protein
MLIEGGYLDSLKKLIEKADATEKGSRPRLVGAPGVRLPTPHKSQGLRTSLRALSAKLFRRSQGSA